MEPLWTGDPRCTGGVTRSGHASAPAAVWMQWRRKCSFVRCRLKGGRGISIFVGANRDPEAAGFCYVSRCIGSSSAALRGGYSNFEPPRRRACFLRGEHLQCGAVLGVAAAKSCPAVRCSHAGGKAQRDGRYSPASSPAASAGWIEAFSPRRQCLT